MPGQGGRARRSRQPTGDAWSSGLRRRSDLHPAAQRLNGCRRALRYASPHRRSCEVWETSSRRSSFCPPGEPLHPARSCRCCDRLLTETVNPSDQWTRNAAYPDQPGDSPHHSTSEDSYFSGFTWLVRPLNEAYLHRSKKTRDKDFKRHGDLDKRPPRIDFEIGFPRKRLAIESVRIEGSNNQLEAVLLGTYDGQVGIYKYRGGSVPCSARY
jgi:hypothetical protein